MPIQILPGREPIGRRDFLAGLAGGAALMASPFGAAADEADWFALLSDTHIAADPAAANRGHVMAANLRRVVAEVLANSAGVPAASSSTATSPCSTAATAITGRSWASSNPSAPPACRSTWPSATTTTATPAAASPATGSPAPAR